jgi:hypothetical protein
MSSGTIAKGGNNNLLAKVEAGTTRDARERTMLHGWLAAIKTANATGTANPAIADFIKRETPLVEQYCAGMIGGAQSSSAGAQQTGG